MNKALIIVEHTTSPLTYIRPLITAASQISDSFDICLLGGLPETGTPPAHDKLERLITIASVDDKMRVEDAALTLESLCSEYDVIIMASTGFARSLIPRLAGLLMISPITDVTQIKSPTIFQRPIYAGNAFETIENLQNKLLLTVRITSFSPSEMTDAQPTQISIPFKAANKSRFVSRDTRVSTRPDLSSAQIVVSGGAGLGSEENFKLIEKLADHLGAAVGASRAAVDAGYVNNDAQVGQTGKIVAPTIYVAIGISGAIQHLAGMKDSQTIIAINHDPEAPIFKVADIGYCGDLFKAIESMLAQ